ncbi:MAG: hypothetical protein KAT00_07645 [Planctomycetes bacterium]|nr:hypothetical protein [Planctomycetota bacterium]
MKRSDLTYILCCIYAAMTSFFYCCIRWFHITLPRYYPTERTWKWVNEKGVPSQGWYSMQVFAYVCAGIVTFIAYMLLKGKARGDQGLKPAHAKYIGAAATIMMVVAMSYITYYEFSKWGVFDAMLSP